MATEASKFLFLFLLSIHTVSSSSELSPIPNFKQKGLKKAKEVKFHSYHREQLNFHYKATQHDSIDPPTTTLPTTPVTNPAATPVMFPPYNPTPTIITVPATNPVTVIPTPADIPVTVPSTNPVNSPPPITNPVTTPSTVPGAQPVTNPATTYPTPSGGVPVTTPVTNPVTTPAATNPAAVPGQSWCVANNGASENSLQQALDYACGIGGADCSAIQDGGSCYNPNTLQNHASYAFNSYFQKNPVQSSCDFGGAAMITNTNPSSGSCIYPLLSSTSASPATTSSIPATTIPTPSASSSGPAVPGSGTPPTFLNMTNPASGITGFGESPPNVNPSTSMSSNLQPFIGCIILVASIITGKIVLDV